MTTAGDSLTRALIGKAGKRADELQQYSNNMKSMANLFKAEGFEAAASDLDTLSQAYQEAASTLRQRLKGLA